METHEQLALDALAQQEIDALIVVSHSLPLSAILSYERYGPIVFCEHHEDVAAVYIDHYTAFQQGLSHLRKQGHTSIGICLGRPDSTNSLARKHAYQEVVRDEFVYEQTLTIEDGATVARRWMQQKQRPTAILTASDHVAAGLILELRKQGYQVPGDLSVIGFDGSELAEVLAMTTIAIPYATIGRHAFQLTVREDLVARPQIEVPSAFIAGTTVLPHT